MRWLVKIISVLLLAACSSDTLDEYVKNAPITLLQVYPLNGTTSVPLEVTGYLEFNKPFEGDMDKITVSLERYEDSDSIPEEVIADFHFNQGDEKENRLEFKTTLRESSEYCLKIDIAEQSDPDVKEEHQTTCFSTVKPCGVSVLIGMEPHIDQLGGASDYSLWVLNNAMNIAIEYIYLAMIMESVIPNSNFPMTFNGLLSGFNTNEDGDYVMAPGGTTSELPGCEIKSNGSGRCYSDEVVVPFSKDGFSNVLKVNDAEFTWNDSSWENSRMDFDEFFLDGYATEESVVTLLLSFGEGYAWLNDHMVYDLDIDGDGVNDAMTFQFSSEPVPMTLKGVGCD